MKKILSIFIIINFANLHAEESKVNKFLAKFDIKVDRPKSCPLESKKLSDTLSKIDSLKVALKNNCLQDNNNKLDDIYKSFQDLETELKNQKYIDHSAEEAININLNDDPKKDELNGVKFSTLFGNINTLIKKKQCNLEDGRVLNSLADLVYDSTKLGLASGNDTGIFIAGVGILTSSTLRLIDAIIKEKFDFEKITDRQSFIKLNCSFYDIRNTLESEGVLEVENSNSKQDLKDAIQYIEEITAAIKANDEGRNNINNYNAKLDAERIRTNLGEIAEVKKSLLKLKDVINQVKFDGLPEDTKRMLAINEIVRDYEIYLNQLNYYRSLSISPAPILDDMFLLELKKLDPIDNNAIIELLKMSNENFTKNIKPIFLFHIVRIVNDIDIRSLKETEQNAEAKKSYLAKLDDDKKILIEQLQKLNSIKSKLEKIVSNRKYTGLDDGSDNLIGIIEDYKAISNVIYGDSGDKFLKYSTQKALDEIDSFNDKYNAFLQKHNLTDENLTSYGQQENAYFCQNVQRLKINFKYADSLVQEGYDFLITNKDLISADVKNYYNQTLDETENKNSNYLSSIEKIQRHYYSTILAMRILKGKDITEDEKNKYLSNNHFYNKKYLGQSILKLEEMRKKIKLVQDAFDKYNCYKIMKEDIK